jgi:hypothetical protein
MIARALHPEFFAGLHLQTRAIVAAVAAGREAGADGGLLYAGLSGEGCTIDQFQALVGAMVGAGLLCRVGERYYLGEAALA